MQKRKEMTILAKKQYDYRSLKGRIIEKFNSQKEFASYIGWRDSRVSRVLTNKGGLSRDEIDIWCNALEIDLCDVGTLFFMPLNLTNVR